MEERERDRRDLSLVSLSAVPLFVNTLARPLLAKIPSPPATVSVFGSIVNRVSNPNYAHSFRSLHALSPT